LEFSAQQAEASTFVFADLAGFTALTEAHGDEEASRIAADFKRDFARPSIGMLVLFCAWAVAFGFHYRLVREVL
jgi:hypothetical protein